MKLKELARRLAEIVEENDKAGMSDRNELPVVVSISPLPRKPRQHHKPDVRYLIQYAMGGSLGLTTSSGQKMSVMELATTEGHKI